MKEKVEYQVNGEWVDSTAPVVYVEKRKYEDRRTRNRRKSDRRV